MTEECENIVTNITQFESDAKKTLTNYILYKQHAQTLRSQLKDTEKFSEVDADKLKEDIKNAEHELESKVTEEQTALKLRDKALNEMADARVKITELEKTVGKVSWDVKKNEALINKIDLIFKKKVELEETVAFLQKENETKTIIAQEKVDAKRQVSNLEENIKRIKVDANRQVSKLEEDIKRIKVDAKGQVSNLEEDIKLSKVEAEQKVSNIEKDIKRIKVEAEQNVSNIEKDIKRIKVEAEQAVATTVELKKAVANAVKSAAEKTVELEKATKRVDQQVMATIIANYEELEKTKALEKATSMADAAQHAKMKSEQALIRLRQTLVAYNQNTENKDSLDNEIQLLNPILEDNKINIASDLEKLTSNIDSFKKCIDNLNIMEINTLTLQFDLYENNIDYIRIIVDRFQQFLKNSKTVPKTVPSNDDKTIMIEILNKFTAKLRQIINDANTAAELSINVAIAEALDKGMDEKKAGDDAFNKVSNDAELLIVNINNILMNLSNDNDVDSTANTTDTISSTQQYLYSDTENSLKDMTIPLYITLYYQYKNSRILKKETIMKYIKKFNDQYNEYYDTKNDNIHSHITQITESGLYEIIYEQLTDVKLAKDYEQLTDEQLRNVMEIDENVINSIKQYCAMYYILNLTNRALEEPTYYRNEIKHMLWNTHNRHLLYNEWIKYFIRHISTRRGNFYFEIKNIATTEDKLEDIFSNTSNIKFHLITSDEYKENKSIGFNNVIFSNDDSSINIKIEEPADQTERIYDRSGFQYSFFNSQRKRNCRKFNDDNKVASCKKSEKCYKRCIFIKNDGTPIELTDTKKQIYFYIYSETQDECIYSKTQHKCIDIDITKSVLVIQENDCKRVVKTEISIVKDDDRKITVQGGRLFMKKSRTSRNKIIRLSKRKTGGSVRNNYRHNNAKSIVNKNKRRN